MQLKYDSCHLSFSLSLSFSLCFRIPVSPYFSIVLGRGSYVKVPSKRSVAVRPTKPPDVVTVRRTRSELPRAPASRNKHSRAPTAWDERGSGRRLLPSYSRSEGAVDWRRVISRSSSYRKAVRQRWFRNCFWCQLKQQPVFVVSVAWMPFLALVCVAWMPFLALVFVAWMPFLALPVSPVPPKTH